MRDRKRQFWKFGEFRLEDCEGGGLSKDGKGIHLKPKTLEVLRLLVESGGAVVSREEMLAKVWKDTHVEEGNINYSISRLRKKLRENGDPDAEYIRTVPKVGYRFAVSVVREPEKGVASVSPSAHGVELNKKQVRRYVLLASIAVLLMTSFSLWWSMDRGGGISSVPMDERSFRSIVILPPVQLNGEVQEKDRLIGISIADAVTARLAELNAIAVRPITAALEFETSGDDELAFARGLNADAVLSSTYLRDGGMIRLNCRLLDSRDGAVLWTGEIDLPESNVLQVQNSGSNIIVAKLASALRLGPVLSRKRRLTGNDEAYELYLKGKYFVDVRHLTDGQAVDHFRRAVRLDPSFAEAYVGIAEALAFEEAPGTELNESLDKAIELDPTLSDAWVVRGFVRMFNEWDWEGAEADISKAIELDPNNHKARQWYGTYFTLKGDFGRAREQLKKAQELNPSSHFILQDLAELLYFERRFDEAELQARSLIELAPESAATYRILHRVNLVRGEEREAIRNSIASFGADGELGKKLRNRAGNGSLKEFAASFLEIQNCGDANRMESLPCAEMFLLAGDRDGAIGYLHRAAEKEMFLLPFVNVDPVWDVVRNRPDFQALISKMGLSRRNELSARNRPH